MFTLPVNNNRTHRIETEVDMLVLSRKINDTIIFPGLGITVKVVSLGNGRVQLGIDAPRDIQISRPDARQQKPRPVKRSGMTRRRYQLAAG